MRVYGSSPLYNLVELIFRSKRLFILCIVLATAAMAGLAAVRSGQYTATAVVLLADNPAASAQVKDTGQPGSVRYKLNVARILARDPQFLQQALEAYGLRQGMPDAQFAHFCRSARNALVLTSGNSDTGENVLEISCRWPDARAADIINAFYALYSRHILEEETGESRQKTQVAHDLYNLYTQKEQDVDKQLIVYQSRNFGDIPPNWEQASASYTQQQQVVHQAQTDLDQEQAALNYVNQQLKQTPKTYMQEMVRQPPAPNPEYDRLLAQRNDQMEKLKQLRKVDTEANPKVKDARDALAQTEAQLQALSPQAANKYKLGISQEREVRNPRYDDLQKERGQHEKKVRDLQISLKSAQALLQTAMAKARSAPSQRLSYERLQKDKGRYAKLRETWAANYDQATIDARRDQDAHLAEMRLEVHPQSEKDLSQPRNVALLAAGPLLGLLIAFAFALLAESLDHSLRTPMDVEKYLAKPVLAVLPRVDGRELSRRQLAAGEGERPRLPPS